MPQTSMSSRGVPMSAGTAGLAGAVVPRRRSSLFATGQERLYVLLLLPVAVMLVALIAWPIVLTVELSLYDVRLFDAVRNRTGAMSLDAFAKILSSPNFYGSLWHTAFYVVVSTALAFVWGLATAVLVNARFPARKAARLLIVTPWIIPSAIASLIWMFLFDGHVGLINYFLMKLGLVDAPITFLVNYNWAIWTVIIASAWKSYPFFTIMLLSGMQSISRTYYEAAVLDGASRWRRFLDITLPGLRNIIAVTAFLSALSAFREVETILIMTGGGPARATETLSLMIYNETFEAYRAGQGAALGVIAFLLSFLLMTFGFRRMMKDFF